MKKVRLWPVSLSFFEDKRQVIFLFHAVKLTLDLLLAGGYFQVKQMGFDG